MYYKDNDTFKAIVQRSAVEKIIAEINSDTEAIFIHSDIGNGKTEIIEQICNILYSRYEIYKLINNNEKIAKEIECICESTKKKIVIIENFFNYFDVYEKFNMFNSNKNITFIFTARTSIFKSRYEQFSFSKVGVYDVNRLDDNEVAKIVNIFEEYGFYPNNVAVNDYSKHIKKNYNSKLQSIILAIFENEVIASSLKNVMNDIRLLDVSSKNILFFMIIAKIMNLDLNFFEIIDLLSLKSADYTFEKNLSISELVDHRGLKTSIKSVTVCTWIIKHLDNKEEVINILVKSARQADIGYSVNRRYENFLGNIISYRHLKFILKLISHDKTYTLKLINDFYQNVKNLKYYKNKYFFWLQYGISAMELNDFDGAEHHFKAALDKIEDGNIPFEINNQYGRLKMELMLMPSYAYSSITYNEFEKINEMLTPTSAKEDDEYYCYKVSSSYYPKIFDKFYYYMTETEQIGLKKMAENNYNMSTKYLLKNKNEDFKKNVLQFVSIYENLMKFDDKKIKFTIKYINKYYAKGEILIGSKRQKAQIHISQISNEYVTKIEDYLKVGQVISAKVINYNKDYFVWNLTCK